MSIISFFKEKISLETLIGKEEEILLTITQ